MPKHAVAASLGSKSPTRPARGRSGVREGEDAQHEESERDCVDQGRAQLMRSEPHAVILSLRLAARRDGMFQFCVGVMPGRRPGTSWAGVQILAGPAASASFRDPISIGIVTRRARTATRKPGDGIGRFKPAEGHHDADAEGEEEKEREECEGDDPAHEHHQ